jgi:hypothetical protein
MFQKYAHLLLLGAALTGCEALDELSTDDPSDPIILVVDAYESNDDANKATPISLGIPVKARIQVQNDVDFYSFSVPDSFAQGGFVIARLAPFPGRPEVSFLNSLKQAYGARNYSSTDGADLNTWISVTAGQTYYTRVSDWINKPNDKAYTLKLEFVPVFDSLEPNNKLAEAVAIHPDSTYKALLFHPGSDDLEDLYDHYKVTLIDSGRIQVSLTQFPKEMTPEFSIFDGNGKSYARFYSTTKGSDLIETSAVVKSGEYIIRVQSWNHTPALGGEGSELPETGTKPYRIRVSVLPKIGA